MAAGPGAEGYRPEVDGLRALAVAAVIINHLSERALPAGYLGVDIFFVISGYVITGSLAARPAAGAGELLAGFYSRRVKRLVPALVACVVVTALLSCLFDPSPDWSLETARAALLGYSNLQLWADATNYFEASTQYNTMTHTWSLGVEEQFYLLFPAVLWLSGFGRKRASGARWLVLVLAVVGAASLAAFIKLTRSSPSAAYYLMPARLWELACGCGLYVLTGGRGTRSVRHGGWANVVLAALVATLFLPQRWIVEATIASVVLTTALIALLGPGSLAHRIASSRFVVFLGLCSYSLYLWHWPVLAVSRLTIGVHGWSAPLLILVMLLLAIASYRYLESPLRRAQWSRVPAGSIALGVAAIAAAIAVVWTLASPAGRRLYLGHRVTAYEWDGNGTTLTEAGCDGDPDQPAGRPTCFLPSRTGQTITALGDSHTGHLIPLLSRLSIDSGIGVRMHWTPRHAFPDVRQLRRGMTTLDEWDATEATMRGFLDEQLRTMKRGDILLLVSRYELRWGPYPLASRQRNLQFVYHDQAGNELTLDAAFAAWQTRFDALAKEMARAGIHIVVFTPIPIWSDTLHPAATRPEWFNRLATEDVPDVDRRFLVDHFARVNAALARLSANNPNVAVFDAFEVLCPSRNTTCSPVVNQIGFYRDNMHLSNEGSNALEPYLAAFLRRHSLLR